MMKQNIPASKRYFGKIAETYDEIRQNKPLTKADDVIIEQFLNDCSEQSTIIDVPCGTGRAVHPVLSKGHTYIGVDISEAMLSNCRKKIGNNQKAHTLIADARHLPLADGEADYLLCIKFIKWLPTNDIIADVLREFRRVCAGRALINVKIKPQGYRKIKKRFTKLIKVFLRRLLKIFNKGKENKQSSMNQLVGSMKEINPVENCNTRSIEPAIFENICQSVGWTIVKINNPVSKGKVRFYILE